MSQGAFANAVLQVLVKVVVQQNVKRVLNFARVPISSQFSQRAYQIWETTELN